jgi:polyisoprenoid-binding protein YceI
MKKVILSALIIGASFTACKNEKAKEKVETPPAPVAETTVISDGEYTVDQAASTLNWKGFKPTGTHNGTVAIKEGTFTVKEGKLMDGNFVFDMNGITVLDIPAEDEYNGKLVGHLKSGDFFDVANNPTATFAITGVAEGEAMTLKGDLTIKGITKSIEFPVTLKASESGVQLTSATFQIDRTEFDIKYKSNKFFENLKDKFINDEFEISFTVKATK